MCNSLYDVVVFIISLDHKIDEMTDISVSVCPCVLVHVQCCFVYNGIYDTVVFYHVFRPFDKL